MRGATSKNFLQVCLVVENCFALAYLRQILIKQPQIRVVGLEHFLALPANQRRDTVFVVDASGLEVPLNEWIIHLRERCSNSKFLVLDQEKSTEQVVRILVMGGHGFIPDPEVPKELGRAVRSVAANQFWVRPEVLQAFMREAAIALGKHAQSPNTTTHREEEILELIRKRLSNGEIAQLLRIRVSTVKFHVSNILSKLQAADRRALIEPTPNHLWRLLTR